jgi:HSP20 family protein
MVETEVTSSQKHPIWLMTDDKEQSTAHYHYWVGARTHKWRPPTDVYETEDDIIVRVEIAGMRESDFAISLNERVLMIEGVRSDQAERRAFHQMEIRFGEFNTKVDLHWAVDSEAIKAEYKDGILRIVLPKAISHQINIGK